MTFTVRQRGEFLWEITDRRKKAATMVIKLEYHARHRTFTAKTSKRYSRSSPWLKFKPAKDEEIALAQGALDPSEIARCVRASLDVTTKAKLIGVTLTMPDGEVIPVGDYTLPSFPE